MKSLKLPLAFLSAVCAAHMASAEDLRLLQFWYSPGELRAVNEIAKSAARAGLTLTDVPVSGDFTELRSALLASLLEETPPDAAQWIVGDELSKLIDDGVMIEVHANRVDLEKVLLPILYDAVRYKDGLSNMPVGIHIENFVVFNTGAFDRIGRPVPTSWAELLEAAPALDAAGILPLVVSGQAWQMQNLFSNVLSSQLSADEFRDYLEASAPPQDLRDQIKETFRILAGLRAYAPDELPDIDHVTGAAMVSRGEAAAYGLGDYVVPELLPGAQIVCTLSPGSPTVLMGVDGLVFVNNHDAGKEKLIRGFVDDFYSNGGATAYVAAKGGVSVLAADHLKEPGDGCAGQSQRAWNAAAGRLMISGNDWQNHLRIVGKFTVEFLSRQNMSPEEATRTLLALMQRM